MIRRLAPLVAIMATAMFFGIALFISIAEQPARLALADAAMLQQWKLSFGVAFAVQSSTTIVAGLASLLAFWRLRDWPWLAAGLAILINWPWTLVMIQPVNAALLAAEIGTAATRALIEHWGMLHAVRTMLSGAALLLLAWASFRAAPAFEQR